MESLPPVLIGESARADNNPQPDVVVMVAWPGVGTVGGATVITIVVPRAATEPEWHTPISPSPLQTASRDMRNIKKIFRGPFYSKSPPK